MRNTLQHSVLLGFILNVFMLPCLAVELRMETTVQRGSTTEFQRNITIFVNGRIYDFIQRPFEEISIFDIQSQDFTVLDVSRRWKAEISMEELKRASQIIQRSAGIRPEFVEMATPVFHERFDREKNELSLTGKLIRYDVTGVLSEDENILEKFRTFADSLMESLLTISSSS